MQLFETYLDMVCPGTILIAFLITIPWERRVWWLVDAAATFVFGLGLFLIPHTLLEFQVAGKVDVVHESLCRIIGAYLIGTAIDWYLCKDSVDLRMFGSKFFTKIVCGTFLLIAQFYSAYHLWNRTGMRYNQKFLLFSCTGVFFWTLGSIIQLLRYKEIGGYVFRSSWLNAGLLLDHFTLLVAGVVEFAFASPLLKIFIKPGFNIDGVHVCLLRSIACFLLGSSMGSNTAPGFLYESDKKAHLIGRLISHCLGFCVLLWGNFGLGLFSLHHVTPMMLCGFYITFLLSIYFRFSKEKER